MCVLYVSYGCKARHRTFGCVAMGSDMFILKSRLLLYSTRSGLDRVLVVLSGFKVKLLCFFFYVCMVVCISWLHLCLCV